MAKSNTKVAGEDVLRKFCDLQPLTAEQTQAWQQRWREAFSRPVKAATGRWTHLGFDWHAFSYEYTHSLTGDEAAKRVSRDERTISCRRTEPRPLALCLAIGPDGAGASNCFQRRQARGPVQVGRLCRSLTEAALDDLDPHPLGLRCGMADL
jgi:hypothetical protein